MESRYFLCTKCGSTNVHVRWCERGDVIWHGDLRSPTASGETLACTCRRCGYRWEEVPLDMRDEETGYENVCGPDVGTIAVEYTRERDG